MEKDPFFGDHLSPCFLNLNWEQSASALSSLVSSPASSNPPPLPPPTDSVVIRELIGRLGTICNSGEISPASRYRSAPASRYATPLNSPPKLNLVPAAAADPGFAERAARLSCFGQFGELSRADGEEEESSIASERSGRKRKAPPKAKGKEPKAEEDSSAKRSKLAVAAEAKAEQEEGNAKAPEPPKQDYIHVRARRGQATDSHSLAERVRREKISERMKFLQDLVPGCNKVTGKAVMLDEIINYVQSLQRQVEFLSMKLSTVNPLLDFNVGNLFAKDMRQPRGHVAPHSSFPTGPTSAGFRYADQPQVPHLQSLVANGMQLPNLDAFVDASSQPGAFWEDDLQSVVQMGFGQNQGLLPTNHMKIEL